MGLEFDLIEHTADIGARIYGRDLNQLFCNAATALFSLLVDLKKESIPSIPINIELNGESLEDLLVKWLAELLYYFETRHLVLSHFWIDDLTDKKLVGGAKGVKFDSLRHRYKEVIKGVSYHSLEIKKTNDGLETTVIFDI